jgi:dihydrofolate reductase
MFKDLESVDTYLLGRKMYPGYSDYWRSVLTNPESDKDELRFAKLADKTPHIVFSSTLKHVDWANTRIATDASKEISKMKEQPGKDMMTWGGGSFASNLIKLNLIDEYRLTIVPVLLGNGKRLFDHIDERKNLELTRIRQLKSSVAILNYRCVK